MPPRTSPGAVDLALDIQALRHLATRHEIGNVLWSGNARRALGQALRDIHGENNFYHLEGTVSKQVLLTRIKLLPSLLERLYEQNNDHRAQQVLTISEEIIHANREDTESLRFQEEFVLLLIQAVLQASLQILMNADAEDIVTTYRTTIDLIRKIFESCEDSVSTSDLKKTGVRLVKDVVTALTKSDKRRALSKATKFLQKYPYARTASDLQAQAGVLEKELGPLAIRQNYLSPNRRTDDKSSRPRARGKKRSHVPDDKPDFFSDESDETSNVTPDDENFRNDVRDAAVDVLDEAVGSEVDSQSSADTPKPPKKRSRKSKDVSEAVHALVGLENGDVPSRSETPVSKSRGKRYPQLDQELNGMESPMFSETRPASERVDHVVRHARLRGNNRTWKPKATRGSRQRSPTTISQEGSSPTYRVKKAMMSGEASDEGGHVHKEIDEEDEDAMDRMGEKGAVLHELHANATKLMVSGPSDPLPEAIKDARQARRRNNQHDPSYSPGEDAHEASPFPDSDSDSDLSRKKVSRLQLVETPTGQRSTRQRRPAAVRPAMYLYGKPCRAGRFEPFEDKLLLKGLQELGWGAWTEIAREYWEGEFTRAPSSLKDRARTLGLTPHAYPRRIELRGRPRQSDYGAVNGEPPQKRGGSPENPGVDDEDQDEDEEDPIEAPNRTPGSGREDEGED